MTALLTIARFLHFTACLLAVAVWIFDRFIVTTPTPAWGPIARRLSLAAFPLILISGVFWFALITFSMADTLTWPSLHIVLTKTHFGKLWLVRSLLFCLSILVTLPLLLKSRRPLFIWLALLSSAALLTTLASAGHAQDSPVHLVIDAFHLLLAAFWPASVLPCACLLWSLRKEESSTLYPLAKRFSNMSLITVALLIATGILNACFLLPSPAALFQSPYGQTLLLKLTLFLLTLVIASFNFFLVRPTHPKPLKPLLANLFLESILTLAILLSVSLLGILPPPH